MREPDFPDPSAAVLLDADHLSRQTFGDAALAAELLGLFADQCHRLLPGIVDPDREPAERADLAHTLKGSALGIGAVRVARISGAIEDALRAGGTDVPAETLAAAIVETLATSTRPL
ncbi:Hpt domain-containing protein [Methylobacterium sp. Leaf94]|uniref:Hpt domain-containing protein n=1 Tax=Methylobacterium sp. Leaf94 TaxID=1736250 RepID=UPI0009E8CA3B|nr:Hpt domain-containing protein [Methylobacterium sp. Leaf94]